MHDNDELLDTRQVAGWLKVAPITLDIWRSKGKGPAYLKLHRTVRYRRADVSAWLAAQLQKTEAA